MKLKFKLLLALLACIMLPAAIMAQAMPQLPQLPRDPEVRYGVLPNGLTYYIRHNEHPKGQADFYIAQKVGSILEEDNQRGLAHFLEHMCFNGTDHFPGNQLISWLETVGVKFGNNLNAYTSVDKTVYNISNVPTARESVQDSCLLILRDWADGLTLDPEEIDKERGVIHQEWRRSNVGQMRILEQLLPTIYPGSKYGYRLPIGTMEVVDNFPPQALRDYYETWYRPDQQGVMVVGDIDVDRIENKIKELFGPIEMPANAPERVYYPVPDHEGTIYAIGHDKEMANTIVELSFLSDAMSDEDRNTQAFYLENYVEHMIASMLNQRLADLANDPNAPFVQASGEFGNFLLSKTKDAFSISGLSKTTEVEPTLEAIYREVLRAARGGFNQSEYDRAKSQYMSNLEKAYNNRASRKNGALVNECVTNFTDGDAMPGIETDYEIMKQISSMIPVELINMAFAETITDDNRVLIAMTPEKDGMTYPTEESLSAVIEKVNGEDIEAFVDNVKEEPLIPSLPKPGKVVKTTHNTLWDATEWTLSNGVKVLVKKTDFKEDEIKFNAIAKGGTSIFPDSQAASLIVMPIMLNSIIGLGDYTNSDLRKYLQGKNADFDFSFNDYYREVNGSTTPKDLPTFMELLYMGFTAPTLDPTEYAATQDQYVGYLANMTSNPDYVFSIEMKKALYDSPREQTLTADIINAASRDEILNMTRKMLDNAADYTFIFSGNVDLDALKPLVEQYIATLPANAKKANTKVEFIPGTQMKGGKGIDTYTMKMETPQTTVFIGEWANLPYSSKNRALASIAGQILANRLLESVREREGAVYSIGAQGAMYRLDPQNTIMVTSFPMNPEKKDLVLGIIETEFDNMTRDVKPEELKKAQEYMVKNYGENIRSNDSWLSWMGGYQLNNVDIMTGYDTMINAITVDDVQNFMKALNAQGNYRVFLMEPAE